jgi:hypothetical protein
MIVDLPDHKSEVSQTSDFSVSRWKTRERHKSPDELEMDIRFLTNHETVLHSEG